MFIILVNYKKPIEVVDQHLAEHVRFLEEGYQKNYFVVAGRRNPRTGGVIVSQLTDRQQLENIIKQDPYHIHQVADFDVVEFTPRAWHVDFKPFLA